MTGLALTLPSPAPTLTRSTRIPNPPPVIYIAARPPSPALT